MYLVLLPVLLAAKCKKCGGDTDAPETDMQVDTDIKPVEQKLQVARISPSQSLPSKAFQATVYGSGFKAGATVKLGDWDAGAVRVTDENTLTLTVPALAAGTYDVTVTNPGGESATLRSGLRLQGASIEECKFVRVNFDTDKAGLTEQAKSVLGSKIACYQRATGEVRVEGHADERGTTDYNIALGQRRADSVKRYLAGQGLSSDRLRTVSYGEERPVSTGHDESAWAENRRADIHASE